MEKKDICNRKTIETKAFSVGVANRYVALVSSIFFFFFFFFFCFVLSCIGDCFGFFFHSLFLISPSFGDSGRLLFMSLAFPGHLHLQLVMPLPFSLRGGGGWGRVDIVSPLSVGTSVPSVCPVRNKNGFHAISFEKFGVLD